jgi:hypothetical protein
MQTKEVQQDGWKLSYPFRACMQYDDAAGRKEKKKSNDEDKEGRMRQK